MDLSKLAPYAAGSPPAVALAFELYAAVEGVTGAGWELLAAGVALLGVVGMMTAEIVSYRKALEALALREVGAFLFSLAAALVCSALVVFAIYSGADAKSLLSAIVVAVLFYATLGVDAYLKERRAERARALEESKARVAEKRAEARKLEAESRGKFPPPAGNLPETFRDWRKIPQAERALIAGMSAPQIVARYNCDERTARNWRKAAIAAMNSGMFREKTTEVSK